MCGVSLPILGFMGIVWAVRLPMGTLGGFGEGLGAHAPHLQTWTGMFQVEKFKLPQPTHKLSKDGSQTPHMYLAPGPLGYLRRS